MKNTSLTQESHVRELLESAQKSEKGTAKEMLSDIIKNINLAKEKKVPICQDTG